MAAASRTAEVYGALKQELLDSVHAPGSKLGIDQLAERFKVSAGAVREALSRLTSDWLVIAQPQRGFVVAPISARDLIDITAVRVEIEIRCLRRSIELGTLEWEAQLLGAWHQLSRTRPAYDGKPDPEWARLHAGFHDNLVAACDSVWWLRLREQLYTQAERYRRMILPQARVERDIDAEHRAILDFALAHEVERAARALSDHMQLTTEILLNSGVLGPASAPQEMLGPGSAIRKLVEEKQ
ncbi:GntR family transcriptional regulator [Consotaella aegiceratis]|uniref:GntR family transcriptional regulator n=1 Tax=Consotaella aegiceratis TaxID=3097961 RepID=UPI002F3E90F0